MNRTSRTLLLAALYVSFVATVPARAAGPSTVGAAPNLPTVTSIADVTAKPQAYEGKTVRVEGVVTAVCTVAGCWMALAPSNALSAAALRFKVEDGVIVFPIGARGRRATAQGVVERIQMGDAHAHEAAAEHAHAEHAGGSAVSDQWHVRATGATIY